MRGQRPQDLVFTLFGEYLLERSDSVWVGSLIALLEPFGLTEGGVRTVLSRMAKKGWLASERSGRSSFYALTERGRSLLEEGQARIYDPSWDRDWDGAWFLLAYSIPQDARSARDRLRDRLDWLGFGSIGNGLWISSRDVQADVRDLSAQLGLGDHLLCFQASPVGTLTNHELVDRCWDLEALHRSYREFAERWTEAAQEIDDSRAPDHNDARAFALRFELIHEFRRFSLEDPFLPRALLPDPWAGDAASAVFRDLHDRLVGPADRWVSAILRDAPDRTVREATAS
ncbi:MAG: PaaX family transcriptional regulator C-terminal domain-containing protein [Longimicrobiales bacterium]